MTHKKLKYGDLNPVTHPQNGRSLDPDAFSGIGNLAEAARRVNTPSFVEKLGFPLKGIVLRVENGIDSQGEPLQADEGWAVWTFGDTGGSPVLYRVRVRIPELHAHLPIPEKFGPEGLNSVMIMYPVFQAKDQDMQPPVVGEICYVDFGDRKRFEDPIYLGMVKSGGRPVGAGASSESTSKEASQAANQNPQGLGGNAPSGDTIGQGKSPDSESQNPAITTSPPNLGKLSCEPYTRNSITISPSCSPYEEANPGDYRTTGRIPGGGYEELGKREMSRWKNRGASDKLVLASLKHTLQLMEKAFIKDTGITEVDVKKFINDGFRSFERQSCYRQKYESCLREWRARGSKPEEKPYPVARPGPGKHSSGEAVDFNADGTGRGKKTRTTELWLWLQSNSTKFGWVWAGKNYNPQEAWHYEFDYELAKSLGLFPRDGVSEDVSVR